MSKKKLHKLSTKKYECNICRAPKPAYYIFTHGIKGLWIQCDTCGVHARPFIANLDLPRKVAGEFIYDTKTIKSLTLSSIRNPQTPQNNKTTNENRGWPHSGVSPVFVTQGAPVRCRLQVIEDSPQRRICKIILA